MTRDNSIRLNAQISEEAAEWFIEFRTGDIDAGGRRAFDTWVRSSQEHLRAYLEFAAIWNEVGGLGAEQALDVDDLIAFARAEGNIVPLVMRSPERLEPSPSSAAEDVDRSVGKTRANWKRQRLPAIAACAALLTVGTATVVWFQSYRVPTYATVVGEQRSFRLPDGSTVALNSRSRIRVKFTDAERAVELIEGQALFQVAKNPKRPFIVASDDTRVRAVGTQFDVYQKRGGTVVTVVEGKVAVQTIPAAADNSTVGRSSDYEPASGQSAGISQIEAPVLLSAGEQMTVTEQTLPRPTRVDITAATAWTQRQIVLDSVSLTDAAEEFNRYSSRRLTVEDTASTQLRLSGIFTTDPEFLVRYLHERSDITVHVTDTEIRIIHHD